MTDCTHHWTVTSPCPFCQRDEIEILRHGWDARAAALREERDRAVSTFGYQAKKIERLQVELAAAYAKIERMKTRPDSEAADAIKVVREFLRRVTHWQEGKPDCHDALEALDKADDDIDWIEHGIVEWRDVALKAQANLAAAYAELRKLRPGLTAIFDREVHDRARAAGE